MKSIMRISLAVLLACVSVLSLSRNANASTLDCQNLYIGRIWIEKGFGLYAVVFLNNADDSGGSYWQYVVDWPPEDRKALLATLTAAKLSQHRVNVLTDGPSGCGIQLNHQNVKSVWLANNP